MGLQKYKQKRNFQQTPEPGPKVSAAKGALKFVVQRHAASHLHYDFRLEMEGVLKSWAVPKGPSMNPSDKRLAMMVEDHPYDYRTFQGVIPEGNYGAGIVEIWDEGVYHALEGDTVEEEEKSLLKQLEKGRLKFFISGKKLKGQFSLFRVPGRGENAWLLVKSKDEHAVDEPYNSEELVPASSPINKKLKQKEKTKAEKKAPLKLLRKKKLSVPEVPEGAKKAPFPGMVKPTLAKLIDGPFDDPEWIFEIKWDGYRCLANINNGKVTLYSRNLLPFKEYPGVHEELKKFPYQAILDGEIVVMDEEGNAKFQYLQNADTSEGRYILYYVFDVLYYNGHDLTAVPLVERKALLQQLISGMNKVRYSDHIKEKGINFYNAAEKQELEGVIGKRANSQYRIGKRTSDWVKIKTQKRQETIICGYTEPKGSRKFFGSLVLGVYDKGELKYVGNSGGGFGEKALKEIYEALQPLKRKDSPFREKIPGSSKITFVEPKLVCEIGFTEWTSDNSMRHPVFLGMRNDKKASEVTREKEAAVEEVVADADRTTKKTARKAQSKKAPAVKKGKAATGSKKKNATEVTINGHTLTLTNLSKIYFPDDGITKGDIINYYRSVSKFILPYLKDRPQSMNRHPNGIYQKGFYHKDHGDQAPDWVETFKVPRESSGGYVNYLLCQNEATLIYMANLGCIEINPWSSRIKKPDHPDYVVIDLDPAENTFEDVIASALAVKEILDRGKIPAYCKTSGSTGMHIYIPLGAKYTYEQGKQFAHIIATLAHQLLPDITSIERMTKARTKQVYLDYLQNNPGQTLASVYSARPRPGATVSTPLEWKEIKKGLHPSQFTIKNILSRIEKKGDIFRDVLGKGIDMKKSLKNLGL